MRLYTRCGFRRNDLQTFIILWMTLFINKKLGCYRKNRAYSLDNCIHKKVVLSQRWPRNAPINGCPENFRDSLTTLAATLPKIFHRLLFWLTLWMCVQNLKSVALPVQEIIGGTQKIGRSLPGYAHTLYPPQKILDAYHTDYLSMCTRFPAIFDCTFELGLRTPNVGKGRP